MSYNLVSVGSTPTLIVPANNGRRQLILDNQGSVSVFIGPDTSITSSNTVSLRSGTVITRDDRWYGGAVYGITASGTASVAYWESTT